MTNYLNKSVIENLDEKETTTQESLWDGEVTVRENGYLKEFTEKMQELVEEFEREMANSFGFDVDNFEMIKRQLDNIILESEEFTNNSGSKIKELQETVLDIGNRYSRKKLERVVFSNEKEPIINSPSEKMSRKHLYFQNKILRKYMKNICKDY